MSLTPVPPTRLFDIPLLRDLSHDVLEQLRPHLFERAFEAGVLILREGEYCDGAYYLIDGRVEVRFRPVAASAGATHVSPLRPAQPAPAAVVLPESPIDVTDGESVVLGPGDIFAEGSALSRYPIATDIAAVSDVQCLLIRTPALRAMLDLPELASFKAIFDERYRQRTLHAHLYRVGLFADLEPTIIDRLIDSVELLTFKPGRVIAEQGDNADAFYLVRGGYVKVSARTGATDVAATYLRKGDWIGETSLLLDEPWPFSLTALEHVELMRLTRQRMSEVLRQFPGIEPRLWATLTARLKQVRQAAEHPLTVQSLQFAMDSGLIHGESVLVIDLETCTRCDECVRACADAHEGVPRFVREGRTFKRFSVPTACYQCTDPVCMIGCPTGAITRPLGTLEVAIDKSTCIGCGNCVRRCPWDNIIAVPYDSPAVGQIGLATKCDLCIGRSGGPACVQMCPHGSATRVNFKQHELVDALLSR